VIKPNYIVAVKLRRESGPLARGGVADVPVVDEGDEEEAVEGGVDPRAGA
jgi:hypothetical protein